MSTTPTTDRVFRYDTAHAWFKGNTHIHSTASDGGMNFAQLAAAYAGAGYHFLFRTDHWVASDVGADPAAYPLLWLDGVELDGRDRYQAYYHVVCLGTVRDVRRDMGLEAALRAARQQGALLVLAHPYWTGNTLPDACRHRFDAVEVYNHVCHWLNGKSHGGVHWHAMLARKPGILGMAVDDAHVRAEHPGWDGGWLMVNAPACSREALLAALRRGNYYSSCGPEFRRIERQGERVCVQTSAVQFVRLVGPGWCGERHGAFTGGDRITEAAFNIPADWPYAYLEIEDAAGRRAWTNTLFL